MAMFAWKCPVVEWFVEVIKVYRSFPYPSTVHHWMTDTIGPKVCRFNFYCPHCNIHYQSVSRSKILSKNIRPSFISFISFERTFKNWKLLFMVWFFSLTIKYVTRFYKFKTIFVLIKFTCVLNFFFFIVFHLCFSF